MIYRSMESVIEAAFDQYKKPLIKQQIETIVKCYFAKCLPMIREELGISHI